MEYSQNVFAVRGVDRGVVSYVFAAAVLWRMVLCSLYRSSGRWPQPLYPIGLDLIRANIQFELIWQQKQRTLLHTWFIHVIVKYFVVISVAKSYAG